MTVQLTPISSKAKLPTAINSLNTVIRQLAANASTQVVNQGGGKALVSGKLSNGRYGEVFYDSNGVARILVGQDSSGEPVVALSGDNTSILDSNGLLRIGKLANARYGELLYDANGNPRMVFGQDTNGDPMFALSSGNNSVLSNPKMKIGKLNSTRYGQLFYDSSNVARLLVGEDSNGDPMFALSSGSNSVLSNTKVKIGKLNSTRYGQVFYDSSNIARLLIGEDSSGNPTIALSSGSNSVLTAGNERFKICNVGSNRYAQIITDANNVPRIYIGQNPSNGKPIVAISRDGVNVVTALGGS